MKTNKFSILVMLALVLLFPGCKEKATEIGGTYKFGDDVEKGPVGSVMIYPLEGNAALFALELSLGAPSYNSGRLEGRMTIKDNFGTYEEINEYNNCILKFKFASQQLEITTEASHSNCGFGGNVNADNIYKLIDKFIPQYYLSVEDEKIFFKDLKTREAQSQEIEEMQPELGAMLDFSEEAAAEFEKTWIALKELNWEFNKLTEKQQKVLEKHGFEETFGDENRTYWEVFGLRKLTHAESSSWGSGGATVSASSYLKSNSKTINYLPENIMDGSYRMAWVPGEKGAKGYGIGEYITFHFTQATPGITHIKIANGYVKSEKAYRDNSRPKKLKMYIDDKPFAILNLKDIRREQIFKFEPIGRKVPMAEWPELRGFESYNDWWPTLEKLKKLPGWTIKFEILEVYKGDKYDDTPITQIYFDGYDYGPTMLCLGAGTKILMANNTLKNIESIQAGDLIKSYDFANKKLINSKVAKLVSAPHSNFLKLKLAGNEIITTDDHPFWTEKNVWAAVDAEKANKNYVQKTTVAKLKTGDKIFTPEKNIFSEVIEIEKISGQQITYTIELADSDNFIANGMLVKTEVVK